MTDRIRVGIIGFGMAGRGHLRCLLSCAKAKVVGIADPGEEAREYAASNFDGVERFDDYRAMLDRKDLDLVTIATPHYLHLRMALDSFDAGKHVFCEKPLAISADECDRMIAGAKKADRKLYVFQNHRTNPPFRALKRILDENDFGASVAAIVQYLGCELERMRDRDNWKCSYDRAGGGVLLDGGVHVIDLCNWYFGNPVSVIAQLHKPEDWLENKGESTANLLITYESGAVAQVLASFETLLPGSFSEGTLKVTADLYFENGKAYAEYAYLGKFGMNKSTRYVCGADEEHVVEPSDEDKVNYHEYTLNCLADGSPPIVTAAEARMAVAVAEAGYESARAGKRIDVSPLPV